MKCTWQYVVASLLGAGAISGIVPSSAIALNQAASDSINQQAVIPISDQDAIARGRDFFNKGQFSAAIESWEAAVVTADRNQDILTEAIALSYLSLGYQELNQWDKAQSAVDTSLQRLEAASAKGTEAGLWAQVLNTKASLAYHLGQAEPALDLWAQAEDYYRQAKDRQGILGTQINQAQALQSLGFYRRSRQQLEAIAQQLRSMPDSELKVNGLRTLGTALQVLGDLSASRAALFESANIAIAINATNELSATYLSLGRTAGDWGDGSAAMEMFDLAKQVAKNPADALQADLSRLRLYSERSETESIARAATDIAQQLKALPPSRLSVYGAVNLSASLAKAQNDRALPVEQVNQLLATAVESAQALNDKQAEAYALNQWGALYMKTQQWSDALKLTEKSLDIARTVQADDIASQSAWQLGRILKQQNNTTDSDRCLR